MPTTRRISFVAALLALGAAALPAQSTPESILARYTKTIDPTGKLATIEGMETQLTMEIAAAGLTAIVTATQRRPNQMLLVVELPAIGEIRQGYDGTTAWASDAMQGPRILTGQEAAIFIDGADFRAMARTPDLFAAMEMADAVEVEGEALECLKLTWKSSRVTTECYSTATGLMVESRALQESAAGVMEVVSRRGDYRAVDGILVSHRATQNLMGMQQVMTTTRVEFGPQPAERFELPPEIKALKAP